MPLTSPMPTSGGARGGVLAVSSAALSERPLVSVILAVRNEAPFVQAAIDSLLKQDTSNCDLEILVVDGKSSDGTGELIRELARKDSRVRLLINERVKTPFAFNLGITEARGEYVCILGSHAKYDENYISMCLAELKAHGAVGCSGRVTTQPGNPSFQAKLVAWALGDPFGSSARSFRTETEGFVDTIPYPVFDKQALVDAGGYDEKLYRNQDNDLNQKLRARGHKLYLTSKTSADYFAKSSVKSLTRYSFRSGYWNVISLRRNASSMALRHFVPLAFILAVVAGTAVSLTAFFLPRGERAWLMFPLLIVLGSHLLLGLASGIRVSIDKKSGGALLLPFVFLSFHCSYGLGTLWAILRNARSAGPD